MERSVFHIRLQNFEVQAERILDASLRTRPIAVISSHHQNGTIIALSTEAEAEGLCQGTVSYTHLTLPTIYSV